MKNYSILVQTRIFLVAFLFAGKSSAQNFCGGFNALGIGVKNVYVEATETPSGGSKSALNR